MKPHAHKIDRTCTCYQLASEPSEDCPQHGYPWPPRCGDCGRFMRILGIEEIESIHQD